MTQKRQQILDTTLLLVVESGIDALSTLNIAKTAGVAKATLFHHFKTKADLIDELYKVIKSNFQFFAVPEHLVFKEQFSFMWRNSFSWVKENPQKITFLSMYYTTMSIPLDRRMAAKKSSITDLYEMINKAQTDNKIVGEHTAVLVEAIYAQFMATAVMIHSQDEVSAEDCIEDSLKMMLRMMGI